jgi:hypothetical protein
VELKKAIDEFDPAGRELCFVFKDFGQLGLELTGNAVTDVHGQAKSLGILAGDQFVAIDNHPASETTELLIQQLQALPRPGTVVFRRENPGVQIFSLQQRYDAPPSTSSLRVPNNLLLRPGKPCSSQRSSGSRSRPVASSPRTARVRVRHMIVYMYVTH